ncbi:MAG: Telomere recombination, partial [Firmicutes bacterium]|nr:Telomere recombination [Bacillota bacterium]
MPEVLKIDLQNPDKSLITKAVHILEEGGIIAYPTETFYGLGADG